MCASLTSADDDSKGRRDSSNVLAKWGACLNCARETSARSATVVRLAGEAWAQTGSEIRECSAIHILHRSLCVAFGFIWRGCINDKWRVGPVLPRNAPASVGSPNQSRYSKQKEPRQKIQKATLNPPS